MAKFQYDYTDTKIEKEQVTIKKIASKFSKFIDIENLNRKRKLANFIFF
jgi:hypothetical protein